MTKYEDLDGDGEQDENEGGLGGWQFVISGVDILGNEFERSGQTGSNGTLTFEQVRPGNSLTVSEMKPSDEWTSSAPESREFSIYSGETFDFTFLNWRSGEIHGEKWRDDDEDGEQDEGEEGLEGWTIFLEGTTGGGNSISRETTTDENGEYWFVELPPGDYEVSEEQRENSEQTFPSGEGIHSIALESGDVVQEVNFGNLIPPGSIHGQKFFDKNGNGQRDEDSNGDGNPDRREVGLNGFLIELYDSDGNLVDTQTTHSMDLDGDGEIDPWSEMGLFWFEDLPPDTYTVREKGPPDPWTLTTPSDGEHVVDLGPGDTEDGLLFGNTVDVDWGDLPEPKSVGPVAPGCTTVQCYPTLRPFGAQHGIVEGAPWLGPAGDAPDAEVNGQPTLTADGDDNQDGTDDEDGLVSLRFFESSTLGGPAGEIEFELNVPGGEAFVSAWIDFNDNGLLGDLPQEQLFVLSYNTGGVKTVQFPVPVNETRGGYLRMRVSSSKAAVQQPFGAAVDGEVEDHFPVPWTDFGDAPDETIDGPDEFPLGYPTRLEDNGAYHLFSPDTRLGETETDGETGLPSLYADGDDTDNRDDEDGIDFQSGWWPLHQVSGAQVYAVEQGGSVSLTPLATKAGFFSAWIDWNGDGDWQDEGEHVIDGASINSGPSYTTLSFQVPPDADLGVTYARFRYSQFDDDMPTTGGVVTGEVEDYILSVVEPQDYGDALKPYPTLAQDDGPYHAEGAVFLGEEWDADPDGQPAPLTDGDDTDGTDDEDGITLDDRLHPDTEVDMEVEVTASSDQTGLVNAWFDWNRDGDWQDQGEHVLDDEELGAGSHTLPVSVPGDAEPGPVAARFRISETEGLAPTQQAGSVSEARNPPNGEVEDYVFDVPPEDVSDSESGGVTEDDRVDFGPTGVAIDFCSVTGSGAVSVYRTDSAPENVEGIDEENVSSYRIVTGAVGTLAFEDCTELRLRVSTLGGIEDPTQVALYERSSPGEGEFSSVSTSVHENGTPNDTSDDIIAANISSFSEFVLASDTEPLPVELARFEAVATEEGARLTWETASETNNAGFEVQHKASRDGGWSELGFVESKAEGGSSTESHTYRYRAEDLAVGTHRFRLKQVDIGGAATLSDPIEVRVDMEAPLRLTAPAPNPVREAATLSFAVKEEARASVAVYDLLGRKATTLFEGRPTPGESTRLRLDASDLPSGTYLVRLQAGGKTRTQRLIIIR